MFVYLSMCLSKSSNDQCNEARASKYFRMHFQYSHLKFSSAEMEARAVTPAQTSSEARQVGTGGKGSCSASPMA